MINGMVYWLVPHAEKLLAEAARRRMNVSITSVRRTAGLQKRLYDNYRAGRSRYPAAPPGHSMHELGRAFDLSGSAQELRTLGAIWTSWGGTWGAKYGDPIHFEA